MTITKARRAAARTILANSGVWDASTMTITRDGIVTAQRDSDKTYAGGNTARFVVATLDEMVTADGKVREGF